MDENAWYMGISRSRSLVEGAFSSVSKRELVQTVLPFMLRLKSSYVVVLLLDMHSKEVHVRSHVI